MAKKGGEAARAPMSLYRAYRPQNFAEVRGQEHVVSVLEAAIKQEKVAHAYLFAGGRGTGKTSMARILAHALGTSEKDIYEIDAASNRQVDDARELREGVATLPFESTYKFYILDEVHMFTKDAWNTLLKTLEEPPAHAIFVLATTELEKVPETILSRCQVFNFKKPSHEILKKLVLDVAKKEGASLEPAGAELVALLGEGSFRDTLSILQKVLTVSPDKKLSEDEIAKVVGAPSSKLVNDFLQALANKDIEGAITSFHKAEGGGVEAHIFTLLVISKLRGILLIRFAPKMEANLEEQFGQDDLKFLKTLAGKEGANINSQTLAELITALLEMQRAPLPSIPLELALYRLLG
jgi:DNA polymerase III subunit gamma/tau